MWYFCIFNYVKQADKQAVLEGYFENVIGYRLQVTLLKM